MENAGKKHDKASGKPFHPDLYKCTSQIELSIINPGIIHSFQHWRHHESEPSLIIKMIHTVYIYLRSCTTTNKQIKILLAQQGVYTYNTKKAPMQKAKPKLTTATAIIKQNNI